MKQYKVIGKENIEVDGQQVSLEAAMTTGHVKFIEGILNVLAVEGWEPISLEYPFIFVKNDGNLLHK